MAFPQNNRFENTQHDEAYEIGSLSDFIRKRISETGAEQGPFVTSGNDSAAWIPAEKTGNHAPKGMVLHHLDSQLAESALERYLPTPSTRSHLMRRRLETEHQAIQHEIDYYRQLKGEEYALKTHALEQRLALLEDKMKQVDVKIAELNPFQNLYQTLQNQLHLEKPLAQAAAVWKWIPNADPVKQQLTETNQQLNAIQSMLSEQLHDPTLTPEQLSRLVIAFESQALQAEKLIETLKARKPLTQRLNDSVRNWWASGQTP